MKADRDETEQKKRSHRLGDRHGHLVNAIVMNNPVASFGPYVEFLAQQPGGPLYMLQMAVRLVEALAGHPNHVRTLTDAALRVERTAHHHNQPTGTTHEEVRIDRRHHPNSKPPHRPMP